LLFVFVDDRTLRSCRSIRLFVIELDGDGDDVVVEVVVVVVSVSLRSEYCDMSWNEN
jgi:hypothetical protein